MFGNSFDKAMKGTETALSKWGNISGGIDAERDKLLELVPALVEADVGVRSAAASESLGEAANGTADRARRDRDKVRSRVDVLGERLAGLRARRVALTGELTEARDGLARELPGYLEARKTDLLAQWEQAVKTLEPLLIRRRALENLLGQSLALPELRPTSDTGDSETAAPQARLGDIEKALAEIETEARIARFAHEPGAPGPYDVLIVRHPLLDIPIHGLAQGTHVVSAVFARGQLAHLAAGKWAYRIPDGQLQQAGIAARRALQQAEAAKREQEKIHEAAKQAQLDLEYLRQHPEERRRRESQAAEQARADAEFKERYGEHGGRPWLEAHRQRPAPPAPITSGREQLEKELFGATE